MNQNDIPDISIARAAIDRFLEQYNQDHAACPICNSASFTSTYAGYIVHADLDGTITNRDSYKDLNEVVCQKCKWKGVTHDLVPVKQENP